MVKIIDDLRDICLKLRCLVDTELFVSELGLVVGVRNGCFSWSTEKNLETNGNSNRVQPPIANGSVPTRGTLKLANIDFLVEKVIFVFKNYISAQKGEKYSLKYYKIFPF